MTQEDVRRTIRDLVRLLRDNWKNILFYIGLPGITVASIVLFTLATLNRDVRADYSFSQSISQPVYVPTIEQSASSSESPVSQASPVEDPDPFGSNDQQIAKGYASALERNSDVVAWLQLPDSNVNYPVLQAHDNNFYLDKDLDKSYSYWGSIFAHFRNNLSDPTHLPRNTVLFGHNKNDGKLFGELLEFSDLEYAKAHRYLTLTIDNTTTYWLIFSVMDCEVNNDVFYYINANNPSDEAMSDIIEQSLDRSFYDYNLPVDSSDSILTLSTCTYKYTFPSGAYREDVRYVVMARQVREGETLTALTDPAVNPDRRTPNF